jgi:diguanylate cyclase (GGDEF)-like protein
LRSTVGLPLVDRWRVVAAILPDVLLGALFGWYVLGLARHGAVFEPLVDGWLGSVTTVLPALLLLTVARRYVGVARREVLLLGTGALVWSLGGVYFVLATASGQPPPFPSPGDAGFLCFPVLAFVALISRVRREFPDQKAAVWLDVALGALGAATGLAVLLGPMVTGASGRLVQTVVVAAYPLSDLLLVAMLAGVAALQGLRLSRPWSLLTAGVLVFAAADIAYALRVAHDAYSLGTPVDAGWSLGLTLLALGARRRGFALEQRRPRDERGVALVVPVIATVVSLSVLLAGRWWPVSPIATVLAAATLVAAAIRTQVAFRQVKRLHDLGRQARIDELTGLGNRRAMHEHVSSLLAENSMARVAVLLLDLDRFKEINDTLGHHVGDELLRQLGPRLAPVLRPEDLLVRLGGDEFAAVVDAPTAEVADLVAQRVLDRLAEPFELDGVPIRMSASLGIALFPEHALDTNGLLQRADVAMYAAKAAGGGARRYDPDHDQYSRERLRTLEELRTALETDQLTVYYQPQCDVTSGATVGLEALVRWQHPTRGLLLPDAFLPIVELTGLMPALTSIVLDEAIRQCHQWRLDGADLGVSVNLSATSLLDQRLPDEVAWLLTSHDLPAHALTLELTENDLMVNPAQCRDTLLRLKQLGVWLSIDDYGTGYSSLAYLQNLPVDELKLDRTFLADLQRTHNTAIVRSTIDLAHALDLRLVAEGVEDQTTLDLLRELRCDTAQGYHLSRPLPAPAITSWLRDHATAHPLAALPLTFDR